MSAIPAKSLDAAEEAGAFLKNAEVFSALTESQRREISDKFERRQCQAGETVYASGDFDGKEAVIVVKGVLSAHYFDATLGEVVAREVSAGGVFGLDHCFATETEQADRICLMCVADAELAVIASEDLRDLAFAMPIFARAVISHFADRILFDAEESVVGPEGRVVGELMNLFEADLSTPGGWRITKMPKHRAIAEKAGVEDAAVAAVVAKLIQDGLVAREYPGLVVLDYDGVRRRASSRI